MPPLSHRLFALSHTTLPTAGPLIGKAPIGQWTEALPASRRAFSGVLLNCGARRAVVKRWASECRQRVQSSTKGGGFRHQSTRSSHGLGRTATSPKRSNTTSLLGALFGASALAFVGSSTISHSDEKQEESKSSDGVNITNAEDDSKIRLAEVPKHNRDAESKWIIRETGVYDITDFVEQHPGGEVILRACGGSVDPYWKIFAIHQKQEVYDILKEYYIGEIDERDLDENGQVNWNVLGDDAKYHVVDDPFKHDPERDSNLIFRTAKPCNAETPGSMLIDFVTPLKLFFVRNHLWVPQSHESPRAVTIELSDGEEQTYSVDELKEKFKEHTITATLQCAGNRRAHMSQGAPGLTSGLQWDVGAIGTAEFTGVRLRDVLRDAGFCGDDDCPTPTQCDSEDEDKHVHFQSPGDTYAASIPLNTAMNPQSDVLLAWNMNGEPLNRDHGGPLRAIVPGTTAARSVKWLGRISISCEESSSQWQQRDYKCFGPNMRQADARGEDWDDAQAIQETPVQSAITKILPANGNNKTTVQGFAFSGGGRRIVRVDVSADGGQTWKQAELHNDKAKGSRRWAWTLWSIEWPKDEIKPGQEVEFVVKASDDAYNTQPQSFDSTWNFRGLLANAWHRQKRAYADI